MKFERARFVIKGLLIAGIAMCVLALMVQSGSPVLGFYLTMGGLICVVLCLFFHVHMYEMPFCGKRIIRNALVVKVCPHCRRDLVSGTKVKNKRSNDRLEVTELKKLEKLGFRKARRISDVLYVTAGVILVYRMMFISADAPLAIPLLAVSIAFFCAGMIVYSNGCRCPKCGKLQPRFSKYRCVDCNEELK